MGVIGIRVISIYLLMSIMIQYIRHTPVALQNVEPKGLAWHGDIFSPLQHVYKYSLEGSTCSSNLSRSAVGVAAWARTRKKWICKRTKVLSHIQRLVRKNGHHTVLLGSGSWGRIQKPYSEPKQPTGEYLSTVVFTHLSFSSTQPQPWLDITAPSPSCLSFFFPHQSECGSILLKSVRNPMAAWIPHRQSDVIPQSQALNTGLVGLMPVLWFES